MEAGKAIPITIEKNVADRTGKMVPIKVGVCMIGLGKQFKPGQASTNRAGKMTLAAAKAADKKLEGESVNQVHLCLTLAVWHRVRLRLYSSVCMGGLARQQPENRKKV